MKTNTDKSIAPQSEISRREFLQKTSTVAGGSLLAAAALSAPSGVHAASSNTLRIALVGCGGRGSGAANQALSTYTQGPIQLVAMADVFPDRLNNSLKNLAAQHLPRVEVPLERQFIGFDGYKKAIAASDVVILATPPGFRPMQFEEAVRQGKHIFTEKPVAVDGPGVRRFLAAAEEAKKKNLKVGVGLQRHHQIGYLETMKRLHGGEIGDIVAGRFYWNGTPPWVKPRRVRIGNEAPLEELAGRPLTEMEYQLRNWYYFNWLCGDHIVEQHIHNLDVMNWLKNGYPVRCHGMGGCEVRKGPDYGEIFDHHAVEYEFEDGTRMFSQCRHQVGTWASVSEHAVGTKGTADISGFTIRGANPWRFQAGKPIDPYQQEHDDLFAAIRDNKPYSEAENGAKSTLTAIMGRMATYSGKIVEWKDAMNSNINLMPDSLAMDAMPKVLPGPDGMYPHAVPGKTVVV